MAVERRSGRSRSTLALLVLASLTVLTLDLRNSAPVEAAREVASTAFGPFRHVGEAAAAPFVDAWQGVNDHDALEAENQLLHRRLDKLERDAIEAPNRDRQIETLLRLEGMRYAEGIPSVPARVVAGPLTSFESTVEIDRGGDDGVAVGMAVVTDAGLVGRVTRVLAGRSRVQLLDDPAFEFGIRLVVAGDIGVAAGDPATATLRVREGIDRRTRVQVGDAVITSGVERSPFPPDVPVGRVKAVGTTEDGSEQTLEIEPAADIDDLTFVKVLAWESP